MFGENHMFPLTVAALTSKKQMYLSLRQNEFNANGSLNMNGVN